MKTTRKTEEGKMTEASRKTALVAGSFDPVTAGHFDIIRRTAALFDKVYVVSFNNTEKKYMFNQQQREEMLKIACRDFENVITCSYGGLLADFAAENGVGVIVKGIRDSNDLAYELDLATINRMINDQIETVFIPARPEYMHISSTFVRDMIGYKRSIDGILPPGVAEYIEKNFKSSSEPRRTEKPGFMR